MIYITLISTKWQFTFDRLDRCFRYCLYLHVRLYIAVFFSVATVSR